MCEADEYPASAIEKRPKFHFLHPHMAVLSGIAWDHINVFPTFENYKEQFAIFLRTMEPGGKLIYNSSDPVLKELVEKEAGHLSLLPYEVPTNSIENGVTSVILEGHSTALQVFGEHNLMNINAAWHICRELGVDIRSFMAAISSFTGAAKRMELIGKNEHTAIYRDFAHAPSKVKATMQALKAQYPGRKLLAVLELHTYSSLNRDFLTEYKGAMDGADKAVVFYSQHALEIKRMPDLPAEAIYDGFGRTDLQVITNNAALQVWLDQQEYKDANLLLMSSGTYDGLEFPSLKKYL
ncbi:hypothetical protein MKQ70_17125 [Chitinophaga sedimenti]|uniref:glutamate ligase domain-containing protein n=1 Tax=Chitinophaga sedimenti TaxID=2033606 RepID=UPI0020063FFC|nr:Mur ligase family protein [Chitinophaga sedimenti]MCK7556646.1 hypothetical protein [Chitinophaga sedimenti]